MIDHNQKRMDDIRKKLDKLNARGKLRHYTRGNCKHCHGTGGQYITPTGQGRRFRYCKCIHIELVEAVDLECI